MKWLLWFCRSNCKLLSTEESRNSLNRKWNKRKIYVEMVKTMSTQYGKSILILITIDRIEFELTFGFNNSFHCGFKKYKMPFEEPSSVMARISRAIMMAYGNKAKKYDAFPELFTPWTMMKKTIVHAVSKHNVNRQLGRPEIWFVSSIKTLENTFARQ